MSDKLNCPKCGAELPAALHDSITHELRRRNVKQYDLDGGGKCITHLAVTICPRCSVPLFCGDNELKLATRKALTHLMHAQPEAVLQLARVLRATKTLVSKNPDYDCEQQQSEFILDVSAW